jgi:hypothetical protein
MTSIMCQFYYFTNNENRKLCLFIEEFKRSKSFGCEIHYRVNHKIFLES